MMVALKRRGGADTTSSLKVNPSSKNCVERNDKDGINKVKAEKLNSHSAF